MLRERKKINNNWIFYLYNLSYFKVLWLVFAARFSLALVFGILGIETEASEEVVGGNIFVMLFLVCIFAPITETFVNQYVPYRLLRRPLKGKLICLSIISGIIFGLFHYNSVSRMIFTGIIGFCLQLIFVLQLKKYGTKKAFLGIIGVHSAMNFVSTMIFYIILTSEIDLS